MLKRKVLPIVLISSILTTVAPVYSLAKAVSTDQISIETTVIKEPTTTKEPTQKELENIIKTVKSKITIPSNLSNFDYSYRDSSNSSDIWNLNWSNKDNTQNIRIQSDEKGNILYYNFDKNESEYAPKYLKKELIAVADKFIKKVAPDIYDHVKYTGSEYQGSYNSAYVYTYQRVENGIPVVDNSISISVNYNTGKVVTFETNWVYGVNIPSAEAVLTEKEAAKKVGGKVTMKLSYKNAYSTDKDGNSTIKAFLVYEPDNSYVAVDAKTGEVYTTQDQWVTKDNEASFATADSTAKEDKGINLTEEEMQKIEELEGLITKEAAINAVIKNDKLLIDSNFKSISANLVKQNDETADYVWNITLSDPREVTDIMIDIYRASAFASVDAKTGKLLSFYTSVKDINAMSKEEANTTAAKYSTTEGQKIFEAFVNTQIPEYLKNSQLTSTDSSYVIAYKNDKEVYGGNTYRYDRVNEGVPYSDNSINGGVDLVTGKIYSFSYYWNKKVTFESPKDIISVDKAFDSYISKDGFALAYEVNTINTINSSDVITTDAYSVEKEIRLVYRTDIAPLYISPFTGKQLDYDGKEYSSNMNTYSYSDIKDSKYARSILFLADMNIGFTGGKFMPDQAITKKELKHFLSVTERYYYANDINLKENDSLITRIDTAKMIIKLLNYDQIATIDGLFNADFKDKDLIGKDNLGYAALAKGLKLISCNTDNEFNPQGNLTRGEAAKMVVAMLSVDKQ